MVRGFRLRFTSPELKKHFKDRSNYHRKRAEEKAARLSTLRVAGERAEPSATGAPQAEASKAGQVGQGEEPVGDLERDIKDHLGKTSMFDLFAEHLFAEDYDLEESDLVRLELLRR
ncbi:hypothetical protein [Singulisphaera sp. PoT]|uniref:hypothetical protein n=1 Tax=Singulisphaera sp. PoT TaxID=3411797 RepID=UPI003BF46612